MSKVITNLEDLYDKYSSDYGIVFLWITFIVIRFVWIYLVPTVPHDDHLVYHKMAVTLLEDNDVRLQTTSRPIGYPLVLSWAYWLFGIHYKVAQIFNVLLSFFTAIALFIFVRNLYGKKISKIFLVIITFFPSLIFVNSLISSEVLHMFVISMIFLLLQKNGSDRYSLIVIGLLIGLSALIRPITLLLPVVLFVYFLLGSKSLFVPIKKISIISLSILILLAPQIYRNYDLLGSFVPVSTNAGFNLYAGNNPIADGVSVSSYPALDLNSAVGEVEANNIYKSNAVYYIVKNPQDFLLTYVSKIVSLMSNDHNAAFWSLLELERPMNSDKLSSIRQSFMSLSDWYYYIVLALSFVSLILLFVRNEVVDQELLVLLYSLYVILFSSLFIASSRYHFSIIVFLAMFAARYIGEYRRS
jgi:4-amino-4-deoxy-L-arabinose transferase-like glycosyltransferase